MYVCERTCARACARACARVRMCVPTHQGWKLIWQAMQTPSHPPRLTPTPTLSPNTDTGSAIIHLGMSGSVYIVDHDTPAGVHEHFDFELASGKTLRYRDPRRFGSLHWSKNPGQHKLIKSLGPEPLGDEFTASIWGTCGHWCSSGCPDGLSGARKYASTVYNSRCYCRHCIQ